MERDRGSIGGERLCEAAERVMALASRAAAEGGGWVCLSVDARDESLNGFSQGEVDEGIRFLVRLGYIELSE